MHSALGCTRLLADTAPGAVLGGWWQKFLRVLFLCTTERRKPALPGCTGALPVRLQLRGHPGKSLHRGCVLQHLPGAWVGAWGLPCSFSRCPR